MINLLFLLTLLIAVPSHADGPKYRHQEPSKQLEFENVYQDIRNIPKASTSTYILNSTSTQNGTFNVNSATITILDVGNIKRNGVVVSSITNAGEITQPLQPGFLATVSADILNVTGNDVAYNVVFDSEKADQGSDYNNATGVFTAPVTGQYLFCGNINIQNMATRNVLYSLVTSNRTYTLRFSSTGGALGWAVPICVSHADMDASDTALIQVQISGGSQDVDIGGSSGNAQSFFSGGLIN